MDEDFSLVAAAERRNRSQKRVLLLLGIVAFLLGAVATWFLTRPGALNPEELFRLRQDEQTAGSANGAQQPAAGETAASQRTVAEAREAVEKVEQVVEQQGGLDQRLAAMEQRLTRLDLQAEAAMGNSARAEGLLIAFATRRTIERGASLGYLSDQLRMRFGDARPNAVQTVIDMSLDPVTLDQLVARLEGLSPILGEVPVKEGAWSWMAREASELFVIRREDTPSPLAGKRLERARMFLESGRADAAVAEVRLLPNAVEASDWIRDAERYAAAQRALELLEMTAILEPRQLRDSTGHRVQQPSPANSAVR
jgi:hypothetical protein